MLKENAEVLCVRTVGKQFVDDIEAKSSDPSYAESASRVLRTYGADFKSAVDSYNSAFFLKNYGSIPDDAMHAILAGPELEIPTDKPDAIIEPPANPNM